MFYLQRGLGIKEIELQRKRLTKKGARMCNFNPCTPPRNKTPPKSSKMLPNAPNWPLPQRSPTKCLNAIQHSRKTHEWAYNVLKVIQDCTRHTHKHKECVERDDYYSKASLLKRCTLGGVHDNPYGIIHDWRLLDQLIPSPLLPHINYFYHLFPPKSLWLLATLSYIMNFNNSYWLLC